MLRIIAIFLSILLGSCGGSTPPQEPKTGKPLRIVSLDYCADQYVLQFVPRENILAISPDGTADFSYMRETAAGIPTVRPIAENV